MRHGAIKRAWSFRDDIEEPLLAEGRMQAREAGLQLRGTEFEAVFCSPYKRAEETCRIVLHAMGTPKTPVRVDERLRERDFKGIYGTSFSDGLNRELYDPNSDYSVQHGVETLDAMEERVEEFLYDVKGSFPNGNILVVAHAALGLVFQAEVYGWPESGCLLDKYKPLQHGEIMKLMLK